MRRVVWGSAAFNLIAALGSIQANFSLQSCQDNTLRINRRSRVVGCSRKKCDKLKSDILGFQACRVRLIDDLVLLCRQCEWKEATKGGA